MESRILPPKKAVIIGPAKSGKTSIKARLANQPFSSVYTGTIGVDFVAIDLGDANQLKFKLQIWDTGGLERFDTISKHYYRGAHVGIFVLDANSLSDSDEDKGVSVISRLRDQYRDFSEVTPDAPVILLINKFDLIPEAQKEAIKQRAEQLAAEFSEAIKVIYYSAKEGSNIDEIITTIYSLLKTDQANEAIVRAQVAATSSAVTDSPVKDKKIPGKKLNSITTGKFESSIKNLKRYAKINNDAELLTWPTTHPRSYELYVRINELITKAQDLKEEDQTKVAQATESLTRQLATHGNLTRYDIENFEAETLKYRSNPGWRVLLGAIIGAAFGFVIGAMLGAWMGPAAAVPAVLAGAKGAVIGASVAGASGAVVSGFGNFWYARQSDPISRVTRAAEQYVSPEKEEEDLSAHAKASVTPTV